MMAVILGVALIAVRRMTKYFAQTQQDIENVNTVARENLMGIRLLNRLFKNQTRSKSFRPHPMN